MPINFRTHLKGGQGTHIVCRLECLSWSADKQRPPGALPRYGIEISTIP